MAGKESGGRTELKERIAELASLTTAKVAAQMAEDDNLKFRDKVAAADMALKHTLGQQIVLIRPEFVDAAVLAAEKVYGTERLTDFADALAMLLPGTDGA